MKIPESSSRQNRRRIWKNKKLKWIRKNKESRCIVMWDCNMEKCRSWRRCTCFRRFSVKKLRFWLLKSESRRRKVDEKSRFAASFCIKKRRHNPGGRNIFRRQKNFRITSEVSSSQYENRTRVFAVRGRRLNPLTNWPCQPTRLVYLTLQENASTFFIFFAKNWKTPKKARK